MDDLRIFCLSLNNSHLKKITDLNYIPVGLGDEKYSPEWFDDYGNINIHHKNKYYGEYTFHYKLWKNNLNILISFHSRYLNKIHSVFVIIHKFILYRLKQQS